MLFIGAAVNYTRNKTDEDTTNNIINLTEKMNINNITLLNLLIIFRLKYYFSDIYFQTDLSINKYVDQTILELAMTENLIRNTNYLLPKKYIDFLLKIMPDPKLIFGNDYNDYHVSYRNLWSFYEESPNGIKEEFTRFQPLFENNTKLFAMIPTYRAYYKDLVKEMVDTIKMNNNYYRHVQDNLAGYLLNYKEEISRSNYQPRDIINLFHQRFHQIYHRKRNEKYGFLLEEIDAGFSIKKKLMKNFLINELE